MRWTERHLLQKTGSGDLGALGWVEGFEPSTAGATVRSSTTELHPPHAEKNYNIQHGRSFCEPKLGQGQTAALNRVDEAHDEVLVRLAPAVHHATVGLSAHLHLSFKVRLMVQPL